MLSDKDLVIFNTITKFLCELNDMFSETNKSLRLYNHLISKTMLSHIKPIKKHIQIFEKFCDTNKDAICCKDENKLVSTTISYSDKVFIDVKKIMEESDKETKSVIWTYFLVISAVIDPESKAKEILKEDKLRISESSQNESNELPNILSDFMDKVKEDVGSSSDPLKAMGSILQSGEVSNLIKNLTKKKEDGTLDLSQMMGFLQNMLLDMTQNGDNNDTANALNNAMESLKDTQGESLNIQSLLSPLMSSMMGNGSSGGLQLNEFLKNINFEK